MPNTGVNGRVLDDAGDGIAGLVVGAYDICLFGERLLTNTANSNDHIAAFRSYARTDASGNFSITYKPGKHDLVVRVYDSVLRLVGIGDIHNDVSDLVLTLPDEELQTSRDLVSGYIAKGGEFSQLIDGNELTTLIDNHDAWSEVTEAVDQAQHSIDWMLFYLDVDRVFMRFSPDADQPGGAVTGRRLEDALKDAGKRGVGVRLACNQLTLTQPGITVKVPWPFTSAARVAEAMASVPNVVVRPILTHFTAPIHTKFVVIDNSLAYVLGSPFISDYYDDVTHIADDARHGTFAWGFDSRAIKVPVHDVSVRLRGPAIQQLNRTFLLHWTGNQSTNPPPAPPPVGQTRVQVVRTLAGNSRWTGLPHGETSVLESYLRMISQATEYIYLENQYFTAPEVADALLLRLKQVPGLEVIFLTNNKVDITDYQTWQQQTILRMLEALTADERKRLGFFTTWSHAATKPSNPTTLIRNYIHSKVAIVDDNWATVGSANLDGDSLTYSQNNESGLVWVLGFVIPIARFPGDIKEARESETNLTVFDGIEGGPATGYAAGLRKQLWAEHLGYTTAGRPDSAAADLQTRPPVGWLSLWNALADAKLLSLKQAPSVIKPAKVLRFPFTDEALEWPSKADTAAGYLKWAGVNVDKFGVREEFRRFDWKAGIWTDKETETP